MNKKNLICSLVIMSMIYLFSSCKNQQELKITNVDVTAGTFDFVDVNSGNKLLYKKLMLNEQEVVGFYCSNTFQESVTFAFDKDDIVRSGNSVNIKNGRTFTVHAVLKYKLEDGLLTIFSDTPLKEEADSKVNSSDKQEAKTPEKPRQKLQFKGGECILTRVITSQMNDVNSLMLSFEYILKEGTNSEALQVLQENGKIIAPDGTSFTPSQEPLINEAANGYLLIFKIPKSTPVNTLKYVFEKQELLLNE